jgi:hypothetical protein
VRLDRDRPDTARNIIDLLPCKRDQETKKEELETMFLIPLHTKVIKLVDHYSMESKN